MQKRNQLDMPWPSRRPDFSAGERGGRPVPKAPSYPERGDMRLNERGEQGTTIVATFDEAVALAKCYGHADIVNVFSWHDLSDTYIKRFKVVPRK